MSRGSVLTIGGNRGIGIGLVRRYLADGWTVHATTRNVDAARPLEALEGPLFVHRFDVREDTEELIEAVGSLDVLIHNAGVGRGTPRDVMMAVNADAPVRIVQSFLDANALNSGGKIAIMTSQMGARRGRNDSLGDYGDSKAALNDEFRNRAAAWAEGGAVAVVVHPGWVRTDMGGDSAPLSVEESADGIVALLDDLTPEQHGRFWTWDGREHDW